MTCLKAVKAVLARTMFSLHALVTLWRLVSQGPLGEAVKVETMKNK